MNTSYYSKAGWPWVPPILGWLVAVGISVLAADATRLVSNRTVPVPAHRTGAGASMSASFAGNGRFVVFASAAPDLVADDPHRSAWDVFRWDRVASVTEQVSVFDSEPGETAADSTDPSISDDGQWIAFASHVPAPQPQVEDGNHASDVFVRQMSEPAARAISLERGHVRTGNAGSRAPTISGDGRFVVFESLAGDLTSAADDNEGVDLFLWDRATGSNVMVSAREHGTTAQGGASYGACLDGGASVVAFRSSAIGLTTATNGNITEMYLWTRVDRSIVRVVLPGPQVLLGRRGVRVVNPVLSDDGRYLAFRAVAPTASSTHIDGIWWMDRSEGTLVQVADGRHGTGVNLADDATGPAMSRDGRTLAFEEVVLGSSPELRRVRIWRQDVGVRTLEQAVENSDAIPAEPESSVSPVLDATGRRVAYLTTSAVPGTPATLPGPRRLYVRDVVTGVTSVMPGGGAGEGWDFAFTAFDQEGSWLLFQSDVPSAEDVADHNRTYDIFLAAVDGSKRTVVSVANSGTTIRTPNGWSMLSGEGSGISSDGRFVLFASLAAVGAASDAQRGWGVYRWDRETAAIVRADRSSDGGFANGPSLPIGLSTDGRYALFGSRATNLVVGDTNAVQDLFLADLTKETVELVNAKDGGDRFGRRATRSRVLSSSDLHFVAFTSSGGDLVPRVTGAEDNLYLRDIQKKTTHCLSRNRVAEEGMEAMGGVTQFALGESGRWAAFVARNRFGSPGLFVYDRLSDKLRHSDLVGTVGDLAVSDASEVVAATLREAAQNAVALVLLEAGTGKPKEILRVNGGEQLAAPRFAGNGSALLFASSVALPVELTGISDAAGYRDVFHYDLETKRFRMCSVDPKGQPGFGDAGFADVSSDGRFVVFRRDPVGETGGPSQLWIHDVGSGKTRRLGSMRDRGWIMRPDISEDGMSVVFMSEASDLVADDANGTFDVMSATIALPDPTDSDDDGLPDDWETARFGNLNEISDGDPDDDGAPNANEYEANTDPTDPLSLFRVDWAWTRNLELDLRWTSVSKVVYVVERSATPFGPAFAPFSGEIRGDGATVLFPIQATSSGFYRVRVRRAD